MVRDPPSRAGAAPGRHRIAMGEVVQVPRARNIGAAKIELAQGEPGTHIRGHPGDQVQTPQIIEDDHPIAIGDAARTGALRVNPEPRRQPPGG